MTENGLLSSYSIVEISSVNCRTVVYGQSEWIIIWLCKIDLNCLFVDCMCCFRLSILWC